MNIPIAKPCLNHKEEELVVRVMRSGMLAKGDIVAKLEKNFADLFGYNFVVATSSGTTALQASLYAHGIRKNDEVITTPFTFIATSNSILSVGAKPIFVDITEDTFNINPDLIESAITSKTKAIMPVHLYGNACEMDTISSIAKKHHLIIIEDACQAHGATFQGKYVGSWGTAAFSLYPTKNITSAEGGLIATSKKTIAERARLFINHGQKERYIHTTFGLNFRMTNVHAAIGLEQLKKFQGFNKKRQKNADFLRKRLGKKIILPKEQKNNTHVYHQFTIRIPKKRDLIAHKLQKAGIGIGIYYPQPIHLQPYYKKLGYNTYKLPIAEAMAKEVLSLPIHPAVTRQELTYIAKTVNTLIKKYL